MFPMQASMNYTPQHFTPFHPLPISALATPDVEQANINAQHNAYHTFSPGDQKRRVEEEFRLKIHFAKDAYIRDLALIDSASLEPCACPLGPSCTHRAEVLLHQQDELMRIDEEYKQATSAIVSEAQQTFAQMQQMEQYRRQVAFSQREQSVSDATTTHSPASSNMSGRLGYQHHEHSMNANEENVANTPASSNGGGGLGYQEAHYEPFHQPQTRRRPLFTSTDRDITNSPSSNGGGGGYEDTSPRQPPVQITPPSSSTSRRLHHYGDSIIPLPGVGQSNSTTLPKPMFAKQISCASEAAIPRRSIVRPLSTPTYSDLQYPESQYASSLLSPPPIRLNMPVPKARPAASSPASAAPPAATVPHRRHQWSSASMAAATYTSAVPSVIPPSKPARTEPKTSQSDAEPDDEWKENLCQQILRKVEKMKRQKRASHATFMMGIANEDDRKVFDWEYEQSKSRPQTKIDVTAWAQYQFRTEVARERQRLVQKHSGTQRERGEVTDSGHYKRWVPSSTAV